MYTAQDTLAFKLLSLIDVIHKGPEKELKELGITYANYVSLLIINGREGITQAQLAEQQHKDRNVIGQTIDRLEEKQYVQRVTSPKDRRVYNLYLTEAGKRLVEEDWDVMMQGETELLQKLTEEERRQFFELLQKMLL